MSLIGFLLKSKKSMAKPDTRHIKVGKYNITSHAQNRIVDPSRNLKKTDLVDNLFCDPLGISEIKADINGDVSYQRVGKYALTYINPTNNNVASIRRTNKKDAKLYNLERRGRKYVEKIKW